MTQKKKLKKENTKAFEPKISYQSKNNEIITFSSFEEMNEADAKEMAAFTPIENVKMMTEYIMRVFALELKEKMTDLTIHIKKNGHTDS